jgi:hypothetical protein
MKQDHADGIAKHRLGEADAKGPAISTPPFKLIQVKSKLPNRIIFMSHTGRIYHRAGRCFFSSPGRDSIVKTFIASFEARFCHWLARISCLLETLCSNRSMWCASTSTRSSGTSPSYLPMTSSRFETASKPENPNPLHHAANPRWGPSTESRAAQTGY